MARPRKAAAKPAETAVVPAEVVAPVSIRDGLFNAMTGAGTRADRTAHNKFIPSLPKTVYELEAAFVSDGVMERFITRPVEDALSCGVTYPGLSDDEQKALSEYLDELGYWDCQYEALTTMRLFCGAGIWIDNAQKDTSKPFYKGQMIKPKRLIVFDSEVLTAPDYNQYLEPERWLVTEPEVIKAPEIHASRLLIYPGRIVSRRRRRENNGWGESEAEKIWDSWINWRSTFLTVGNIAQTYEQGVYKFKDLTQFMRSEQGRKLIQEKMIDLQAVASALHAHVIDAEDDFERVAAPVSGLDKIMHQAERLMVAQSGFPHTILLGESPGQTLDGGGNGESQHRDYRKLVSGIQSKYILPNHKKFLAVIAPDLRAVTGLAFADLTPEFNPIEEHTELEWAQIQKLQAERDQINVTIGAIGAEAVHERLIKDGVYPADSPMPELPEPEPEYDPPPTE